MATRKTHFERPSYLYLGDGQDQSLNPITSNDSHYEFDESDVWNSISNEALVPSKKPIPNSRPIRKASRRNDNLDRRTMTMTATSLPVNVPDWSKILRDEYKDRTRYGFEDQEDDDGDVDVGVLPPHEYLARTRIASFSVHEGIGRTLKGRDLSRVRNAVWKQTGFED